MSTSRYHKGDVRHTTLLAARRLLDKVPVSDISVRELARYTGVSHAAPYRHFGDRQGFLDALTAQCLAEFVDEQERAVVGVPAEHRLGSLGRSYVDFAVRHPHVFALVYSARGEPSAELSEQVHRHSAMLASAVEDAVAASVLPATTDLQTLAQALWSLAHGLAHLVGQGFIEHSQVGSILDALTVYRTPKGRNASAASGP